MPYQETTLTPKHSLDCSQQALMRCSGTILRSCQHRAPPLHFLLAALGCLPCLLASEQVCHEPIGTVSGTVQRLLPMLEILTVYLWVGHYHHALRLRLPQLEATGRNPRERIALAAWAANAVN